MKGNRRHSIPLTPVMVQLLKYLPRAELLLPTEGTPHNNQSASKYKLYALCPISHWTLHALRRTDATHFAELGIRRASSSSSISSRIQAERYQVWQRSKPIFLHAEMQNALQNGNCDYILFDP
jgi:integrase